MSKQAFLGILEGLQDALAHARGDKSGAARVVRFKRFENCGMVAQRCSAKLGCLKVMFHALPYRAATQVPEVLDHRRERTVMGCFGDSDVKLAIRRI